MPAYWIKPFGTTRPKPISLDTDWTHFDRTHSPEEVDLDSWHILSGPSQRRPPKMGKGDFMLCHAVNHARLFAAAEILASPTYRPDHPIWADRWPWVYPIRVDVWIPLLTDAPKASEIVPPRAMGAIQAGGPYAELSREEYEDLVEQLRRVASVRIR
jgi:hypothetical protein